MKNKGVALLLALLTLIIISLLVVAFLELTTIDLQIVSNHLSRNQALYIAEAGVEYGISVLRTQGPGFIWGASMEFPPGSGNRYEMSYYSGTGIITSTGTLASGEWVILQVRVSVVRITPSLYRVTTIYWREA